MGANLPNANETSHGDAEAEAAVPGEVLLAQLVLLHLEPLLQDLLEQYQMLSMLSWFKEENAAVTNLQPSAKSQTKHKS